jgi:hypothetical protein
MSKRYLSREMNGYEETTTQTSRLSVRGLRGANNYLPLHGNFGHPIRKRSAEVRTTKPLCKKAISFYPCKPPPTVNFNNWVPGIQGQQDSMEKERVT